MFGFYVCCFSRDPCLIHLLMDLKTPCQQDPWNRAFYHMVPDSLHYMRLQEQFQPAVVGALFNLTIGKIHGVLYSLIRWLQWHFDATFWNHIVTTWRTFHEQVLSNVCHAISPRIVHSATCCRLSIFFIIVKSEPRLTEPRPHQFSWS